MKPTSFYVDEIHYVRETDGDEQRMLFKNGGTATK